MKLLVALIILAFSAHCVGVYLTEKYGDPEKIVDMGFMWLPHVPPGFGDLLAFGTPFALVCYLGYKRDWGRLSLWFQQASFLMLMRSITVSVTILPSFDECKSDSMLIFHGGCYDKIFSGHVAYQLLSVLHFRQIFANRVLSIVLFFSVFIEACLLVASREHYTVDVVLAVFLAILVEGYQKR